METNDQRFEQEAYRAANEATEILLVRHGATQALVPGEPRSARTFTSCIWASGKAEWPARNCAR